MTIVIERPTVGRKRQNGIAPCLDCGKPCRGVRCRVCDGKYRSAINAQKPKKKREHVPMLPLSERYPVPAPADDGSPLTEDELLDAICPQTDPDIFFAELGEGYHAAKKVCHGCPIKERCLAWALQDGIEFGVYGGASPLDRKKILRDRRRKADAA
jgi:WhiB family transcriptional regulator, redox-sensing transcriptional regulator